MNATADEGVIAAASAADKAAASAEWGALFRRDVEPRLAGGGRGALGSEHKRRWVRKIRLGYDGG